MRREDLYNLRDPLDRAFYSQHSVQMLMRASAHKSVQQNDLILSIKGEKYDPEAQRYEDLSDAEKGVSVAQFLQDFRNKYPDEKEVKFLVDLIIDKRL